MQALFNGENFLQSMPVGSMHAACTRGSDGYASQQGYSPEHKKMLSKLVRRIAAEVCVYVCMCVCVYVC